MRLPALALLPAIVWAGVACGQSAGSPDEKSPAAQGCIAYSVMADSLVSSVKADSLRVSAFPADSIPDADKADRYSKLTDEDFRIVAEELGVEIAAIKAVVLIEAGKQMKGFFAPGVPVVNFDNSMYRKCIAKAKGCKGDKGAKVPQGLSGYALREWTQLTNARRKNSDAANMGTFWGMFQIGGFNYKFCGCKDVDEMVRLMSQSEFSQLELFAKFITNAGMLPDLKAKNWAGFARKYNGASYARRGYHTRMAAAYRKFK